MGISNDARLSFGIDFGEQSPLMPRDAEGDTDYEAMEAIDPDGEKDWSDLESLITESLGMADPYDEFPEEGYPEYDYSIKDYAERQRAYDEAKSKWETDNAEWIERRDSYTRAKNALADQCPVTIEWHCSYDYPMYILALNTKNRLSASRGYPEKIMELPMPTQEELDAAQKFCDDHNIKADWSEASWLLYSMNG